MAAGGGHQGRGGNRVRRWLDRQLLLDSWHRPGLSPVNWLIVSMIFASAFFLAYESQAGHPEGAVAWLEIINFSILAFFAVEFILRIYAAGENEGVRGIGNRMDYAGRFWLVIDFVAFAPELLLYAIASTGLIDFDVSALKALRLLRLVKLARFFTPARMVVDVLRLVWRELLVAISIAALVIYGAAVVIYLFEHDNPSGAFDSIPKTLWWSVVTLTTVGYGDVVPVTIAGRIAAGFLILVAIGLVGLPSGIIAGAFQDELRRRREVKEIREDNDRREAAPPPVDPWDSWS